MPTSIANDILQQIGPDTLQQISQSIGSNTQQTQNAISTALPLLLGAMGNNASQPQGAQSLFGALQRDFSQPHQAGEMDLSSLLGALAQDTAPNRSMGQGESILAHILGGKQTQAVTGLSKSTGLNVASIQQLLAMLAPIVMSYLGKQMAQGNINTSDILGSLLGKERKHTGTQGGAANDILTQMLDQDGDGKLDMGDLIKLGTSLFGRK